MGAFCLELNSYVITEVKVSERLIMNTKLIQSQQILKILTQQLFMLAKSKVGNIGCY